MPVLMLSPLTACCKQIKTRHEIVRMIEKAKLPTPNISKAETRALKGLKKDSTRMVLTADKGNCFVVMNTDTYTEKCAQVLSDKDTYQKLDTDPTRKSQQKLCNILKDIKDKGELDQKGYQDLTPSGKYSTPPKFYGSPKIHKKDIPMRPIVSSIGSLSYKTDKFIARIIKALMGKNDHHVNSTKDMIQRLKNRTIGPNECHVSFDIVALFSNMPVETALEITKRGLENDPTLADRTTLSISSIMKLLEFCVENTYFMFNGEFYIQLQGAAMGSPVSPILANIFMEHFEVEAIAIAPSPPKYWDRYVDDTWSLVQKGSVQELHQHINDQGKPHIQFTIEEPGPDGGVPFLDTYINSDDKGTIVTKVYRKPTHTDLYLNWHSHHPVSARMAVVRTLFHRAQTVCSTKEILEEEHQHLKTVLRINDYPEWAINKGSQLKEKNKEGQNTNKEKKDFKGFIVIPYVKGLSEPFKRVMEKIGIQVFFKGGTTLKSMLVAPKDKDSKAKTQNIVYNIICGEESCTHQYIGETGRTLEERFKEHTKTTQSAINQHASNTGHPIPDLEDDNVQILCKETNPVHRKIIEGMYIKLHDPELNRNIGKIDIPNIYEKVLREEGALKIRH